MTTVRPAAVAGTFYPAAAGELATMVDGLLDAVRPGEPVKAMVLPHAGYVYSGSTAALGYAALRAGGAAITRVLLLGPTHRVRVRGLALPGVDELATPLGRVPVAADLVVRALELPGVVVAPLVHAAEHSLEVHLPFLQRCLPQASVLPLAVGEAAPAMVARVLDALWGGPETLIVVSSDLSHYHPYQQANLIDARTIEQVLALAGPISHEQACGATPLNGLLVAASGHGLRPRLLGHCNSGDTAGDRQRVVGYAAIAFDERTEND